MGDPAVGFCDHRDPDSILEPRGLRSGRCGVHRSAFFLPGRRLRLRRVHCSERQNRPAIAKHWLLVLDCRRVRAVGCSRSCCSPVRSRLSRRSNSSDSASSRVEHAYYYGLIGALSAPPAIDAIPDDRKARRGCSRSRPSCRNRHGYRRVRGVGSGWPGSCRRSGRIRAGLGGGQVATEFHVLTEKLPQHGSIRQSGAWRRVRGSAPSLG